MSLCPEDFILEFIRDGVFDNISKLEKINKHEIIIDLPYLKSNETFLMDKYKEFTIKSEPTTNITNFSDCPDFILNKDKSLISNNIQEKKDFNPENQKKMKKEFIQNMENYLKFQDEKNNHHKIGEGIPSEEDEEESNKSLEKDRATDKNQIFWEDDDEEDFSSENSGESEENEEDENADDYFYKINDSDSKNSNEEDDLDDISKNDKILFVNKKKNLEKNTFSGIKENPNTSEKKTDLEAEKLNTGKKSEIYVNKFKVEDNNISTKKNINDIIKLNEEFNNNEKNFKNIIKNPPSNKIGIEEQIRNIVRIKFFYFFRL